MQPEDTRVGAHETLENTEKVFDSIIRHVLRRHNKKIGDRVLKRAVVRHVDHV